ncbi:hypothetical protein ARMGADRAFT_1146843 [Armillaria gallica]|uniref:Uncharacterized protein n=1 Tax=Armillaria gallica TaxID=47427 RepID=A0A2H3CGJ2_ARMGA|nr:hypothetical protein ARMGADRAFT_1146843 [Armillaria gallica]
MNPTYGSEKTRRREDVPNINVVRLYAPSTFITTYSQRTIQLCPKMECFRPGSSTLASRRRGAVFASHTNKYGHGWTCSPTACRGRFIVVHRISSRVQNPAAETRRGRFSECFPRCGLTGGGRWCWDDVFAVALDTKRGEITYVADREDFGGESTDCVYARIEHEKIHVSPFSMTKNECGREVRVLTTIRVRSHAASLKAACRAFHRRTWLRVVRLGDNDIDSKNEYNLIYDDAALAVKVSTEVMHNPDTSERIDESSLRRSSKTAGQSIDAPTTTINTGTTSIVTIRNVKFINNLARFSDVFPRSLVPTVVRREFFGYLGGEMVTW